MLKKASKKEIVTSVGILFWIFLVNIVTPMVTSAPPWPMFFVTIFFFTLGGDVKQILSIFLSGLIGICISFIVIKLLGLLTPIIGGTAAMAILLFVVLALIIVGGSFFPLFFNNITFAYLTICTIDLAIIETSFINWLLMFLIGGAIILAGALVIAATVEKLFAEKREIKVENT